MSGHSHFKTIKAQKEVADNKRGNVFSKIGRLITIAAKQGPDPTANSKLRVAMEQAKEVNMPKENVERAIKRGTGELAGESLEEVSFEGFGPGGIAVIVEGITDNTNRTLGEVKQIFNQNNSKLAGEGAVRWMFERKGIISFTLPKDTDKGQIELIVIESGADDFYLQGDTLDVYTRPEELENVKKNLESKNIKTGSSVLGWVPKETTAVDEKTKEACQRFFEALDENDAVQEIYSNIKD